jgi:hypothetical protein
MVLLSFHEFKSLNARTATKFFVNLFYIVKPVKQDSSSPLLRSALLIRLKRWNKVNKPSITLETNN